jgi:hypothetical protein
VLNNEDGTLWVMSDSGFGSLENSSDYHLQVYRFRRDVETRLGGSGEVKVLEFVELSEPDERFRLPSSITLPGGHLAQESFKGLNALTGLPPRHQGDEPCASPIAFVSASRRSASSLSNGNATSNSMRRVISWVTFRKASLTVS